MNEAAAHRFEEIVRIVGERGILAKLLTKMRSTLNLAWGVAVTNAIKRSTDSMKKQDSASAGLSVLLERLRRDLSLVADQKTTKRLIGLVDAAYRTLKKRSSRGFGISFNFSQLDKRAVKALGRENAFWINNLYDVHLSRRISDVGQRLVIEQGLGPIEGGNVMEKALRRELALRGGSLPLKDVVPARYAGNVDEYSRILTSNVANRARNYSAISSMVDAKVEVYRIVAVLDRRTSEICQFMSGKEFTISQGLSQMEAMIGAEPDEIKAISPWISAKQARSIAGKGSPGKQSENLADGGQSLPPYHSRCRTLVEAV